MNDNKDIIEDNSTNLFRVFERIFKELSNEPRIDETLMIHQYILVEFVKRYRIGSQKGLCVYMEMGSGKTHPMCAIAVNGLMKKYKIFMFMHFAQNEVVKKIMNEMIMRLKDDGMKKLEDRLEHQIKFVQIITPKKYIDVIVGDQIDEMSQDELSDKLSRIMKNSSMLMGKNKTVRNKIFLFDECHIFFSMIAKKHAIANMFYRFLSSIDESNLIYYFTGTIIKTDPFEIHALNSLTTSVVRNPGFERLPGTVPEFRNMFVDANGRLKNEKIFMRRIYGLVYYVGSKRTVTDKPELKERSYITCPMTTFEFIQYLNMRANELSEMLKNLKQNKAIETDEESTSYGKPIHTASTINSRFFCAGGVKSKYDTALKLVKDTYGMALIYTTFSTKLSPKIASIFTEAGMGVEFITGETPPDQRQTIVEKVNNSDNRRGEKTKVVILSSVGEMMLNFFNVTLSIVFTPPSTVSQIEQFEMRGVRPGSLKHLPPEKRYVESVVLLSAANPDITPVQWEGYISNMDALKVEREGTIEERGMRSKIFRNNSIKTFSDAIKKASINCDNVEMECYKLEANDMPLYANTAAIDISLPEPSKEQEQITCKGYAVEIDGDKYFYRFDKDKNIEIYETNQLTGTASIIDSGKTDIIEKIKDIAEKKISSINKEGK
ncbi:MAG: DEAD/DEAH box helicase family protein [Candidatus Riesia sp.]|nr:DEAD/DEAH box helicase family protein [Candidatus Riesia sp.]